MSQLGIDGWKLIVQIVAFLIFIFLLRKYALGPIVQTLDKRQDRIREGMEAAQRMQVEMQATAARNEQILVEARQEAQAILSQAREAGEATVARAKDEASKQAEIELTKAQATLRSENEQSRLLLRQEVADLAISAATKIVRKELDTATQKRLIEETLNEAAGGSGASSAGPVA
jgi:F-type H+-transporting ATPase subunit b